VWVTVMSTGLGLGNSQDGMGWDGMGAILSCSETKVYRSATGSSEHVSWPLKGNTILQDVSKYWPNGIELHHSRLTSSPAPL
jgi:hypothetical protein